MGVEVVKVFLIRFLDDLDVGVLRIIIWEIFGKFLSFFFKEGCRYLGND